MSVPASYESAASPAPRRNHRPYNPPMSEVTDRMVDALLPKPTASDDYPALTSISLKRREQREAAMLMSQKLPFVDYSFLKLAISQSVRVEAALSSGGADPLRAYVERCTDAQMLALLAQTERTELHSRMIWLCVRGGWPQSAVASELGTSRQAVHNCLTQFWAEFGRHVVFDPYNGWEDCLREDVQRTVSHAASPTSYPEQLQSAVCECGSHQHNPTKRRSPNGNVSISFTCGNCGTTRSLAEFRHLTGRATGRE